MTNRDVEFIEVSPGKYDLLILGRLIESEVYSDDFDAALRRARHGIRYNYRIVPRLGPSSTGLYVHRGRAKALKS